MTQPAIDPEDVVALLESGPKAITHLAKWLKVSIAAATTALGTLRRAGRVAQVPDTYPAQWQLTPPTPLDVDEVDDDEESIDDGSDDVDDLEGIDEETLHRPLPGTAKKTGWQRQGFSMNPDRQAPAPTGTTSWWTTAPRDGFTQFTETHHQTRMTKNPESRKVNPPTLGSKLP